MKIEKRVLVSLDGECPYHCKHCYTYDLEKREGSRTISEIVDSIKNEEFDIIYVSQKKENFVFPDEGLSLCEELFEHYRTDIIAITRNVFDEKQLKRLKTINQKMIKEGKRFFLAVSIPALESARVTEELSIIPSPEERIDFLRRASKEGISTILVIRPLYPETIIKIEEILNLVDKCKEFVSCILSSGLVVNESILDRLGYKEDDFSYVNDGKSDYLVGAIEGNMKYIDVKKELEMIRLYCQKLGVPFFEHSIPAINYIKEVI